MRSYGTAGIGAKSTNETVHANLKKLGEDLPSLPVDQYILLTLFLVLFERIGLN